MALGYLISTVIQVEDTNGKPLTGGWINVFEHGTTTPAVTYKDFDGDLNQNNVYLDHKGMCTILADADGMYDVYCYDKDGVEQWTRLNIGVVGGAGGASIDITSSDHSLVVSKVITGGRTNFDLTQNTDSKDLLEWIRCDGGDQLIDSDIYKPFYTKGSMRVGSRGIQLYRDRYYHVTAHVTANKPLNAEPYYDDVDIKFILDYGGGAQSTIVTQSRIVDYSIARAQDYEVSADVHPTSNAELLIEITGVETDNTFNLADVEVHRVYSGVPYIPQEWLERIQSDWTENDISKVSYIQHKPDLSVYATNAALEAGLATKQDTISDLQTIREGAALGATAVQDASYVHTDNNFTDAEKTKLSGIAAGAEVNVQSDWNETNTSADSFINNKPQNLVQDANYVHTDNNFTSTLKSKLDGIASGAEVNVQADWNETSTSSDAFINNKPQNLVQDANYVHTDNNFTSTLKSKLDGIASGAEVNQNAFSNVKVGSTTIQADSKTDTLELVAGDNVILTPDEIYDKITIVATDTKYTAGSGLSLNGTEFSNAAPNVKSDWNAAAGSSAEILNKPSIPSIKTTTTSLPPVDTTVSNMTLFTDGVVRVNNSTDVGLLAPTGTQADAGKVLTGSYSGSPGKFTAHWAPVQSPLSAGNGIDITSNTVSAKIKSSGGINVDSNGLYVDGHYVSYDANQGLSSANQMNARKNINALTWNQFSDFTNTLKVWSTGRSFLDSNVVWAGGSARHTWKGMWSVVVPDHCYMLWSMGGQLRVQDSAQTEWAVSLIEDNNVYPASELYSTYFMSNGSANVSTNIPGIWHFYSSGLNQHTVYIGMYNSSEAVPSTGASVYGKIYADSGDGQRKIGPWLTYFIMKAVSIKADE